MGRVLAYNSLAECGLADLADISCYTSFLFFGYIRFRYSSFCYSKFPFYVISDSVIPDSIISISTFLLYQIPP